MVRPNRRAALETYTVSWSIEVDATSAREAAKKAQRIQRDVESIATVYDVTKWDRKDAKATCTVQVDLLDGRTHDD